MRLAERKVDDFALQLGTVADADDVHILLESLRDAIHRIGNQSAGQTMQRAMLIRSPFDVEHAILLFKGNAVRDVHAQLALGPLYIDPVRSQGNLYTRRHWNWFVSDTRHFSVQPFKSSFRKNRKKTTKPHKAIRRRRWPCARHGRSSNRAAWSGC